MASVEIRKIQNDTERQEAFKLRYRIYCQKLGWIDPTLHPDQEEWDEYDSSATHFVALEDGRTVGTVRLVYPVEKPLPIEAGFPRLTLDDFEAAQDERLSIAEVSRLIVDFRNGCPRHAISLGLLQVLIRSSVHGELTHWLQALDKVSFRLIKWFGFRMKQFAPSSHFLGSETIPTVIRIDRCFEEFQLRNPPLFEFVSADVEPSCVAEHAAVVIEQMRSM
jgi:N-acyl-L-homoserine lactone synthetase